MPYGAAADTGPTSRPRTVDIAFWLYLLTAALGLVGAILNIASFASRRQLAIDVMQRQLDKQGQSGVVPPGTFGAILDVLFAVGLVLGVIFLAAYVLFALFVRRGANWARIVLTVFAGLALVGTLLSLLSLVPLPGGAEVQGARDPLSLTISILQFLCLAAATVLVWLRPSSEWFRQVKANKAARAAV
jgi:hypothetical protein